MFKKIEIWVLYFVLLMGFPITIGFGVLVRQEIEGKTKHGAIDISFLTKPAAYIARLPERFITSFPTINQLRVNQPWHENRVFYKQNGFDGTPNLYDSYLLLSRYDGNKKEGIVELIDLKNFKVLHTWNPDIDKFNKLINKIDEFKDVDINNNNSRETLTHPLLSKDGFLFFNTPPLRKIDQCSNLVFQNTHDIFHHSIEEDLEGNIWVPSSMYPQSLPVEKFGRTNQSEGGYFDDAIVKLSKDGKVLYEKSVSQILIDNDLGYLLFHGGNGSFELDPIHLNDIQPVNSNGDYWQKGDLFLSLRHKSMVLLYRPSTNKIIWKGTGPFYHQHDVDILDKERISIFNNNDKQFFNSSKVDGNNEVIIYNFRTNSYSSYLSDSLIENDVRTPTGGRSQIVSNGDLLVEETDFGRTLYFNADGTLRWSHVNRADNGGVYNIGWSRILYLKDDIINVNNFLNINRKC